MWLEYLNFNSSLGIKIGTKIFFLMLRHEAYTKIGVLLCMFKIKLII